MRANELDAKRVIQLGAERGSSCKDCQRFRVSETQVCYVDFELPLEILTSNCSVDSVGDRKRVVLIHLFSPVNVVDLSDLSIMHVLRSGFRHRDT